MKKTFCLLSIFLILTCFVQAQTKAEDQTIKAHCIIQETPPKIKFIWPADANASFYLVSKKELNDSKWGPAFPKLSDTATYFEDTQVEIGKAYEYKIFKSRTSGISTGFTYKIAGIKIPATEHRGGVLMAIQKSRMNDLSAEYERLRKDLIGDGWKVYMQYFYDSIDVSVVKNYIIQLKNQQPDLTTVLLLGHIPVPYSGNIYPDGHPDHAGAWPADVYYADIDGNWTDATVNNTVANRDENDNIPDDGKFDQSTIPSDVDLEIGRIDLHNMPAFTTSELDLLKQYLDKNHNFRHGVLETIKKGLIDDNFKGMDEGFSQTGWRYFSGMFGADNVESKDFLTTLATDAYIWAYGCGAGSYTSCSGIGNTGNFSTSTIKAVFTPLFGSYFGDWDTENNVLRAPLATPEAPLISFWAGRPHWHIHHMDLGWNIGYSTKLSQNNSSLYTTGYGARGIHVALMGDPTLRMHVVKPPSNFQADSIGNVTVSLSWVASTDPNVIGYEVYRANHMSQDFHKINPTLITNNSYTDNGSLNGKNIYMLRAVKLEKTGSGSFYNMSQGIFDSTTTYWPTAINEANNLKVNLYPNPSKGKTLLEVFSNSNTNLEIRIINSTGQEVSSEVFNATKEIRKTLDLSSFGKGTYFIQIYEGDTIHHRKIIIE